MDAKRKAPYLALHPETAAGVAGGKARQGSASENFSFADDQAEKTGVSARKVQMDASRGEKILPSVLALVRGIWKGTGRQRGKVFLSNRRCGNVPKLIGESLRQDYAPTNFSLYAWTSSGILQGVLMGGVPFVGT